MNEKKSINGFLVFLIVLGSLAAIVTAALLLYKRFGSKLCRRKAADPFEFDDDFFFDDCDGCCDDECYCEVEDAEAVESAEDDTSEEGLAF